MSVLDRTPRRAEGSSRDAGEHLSRSGKTSDLKRAILRDLFQRGSHGVTAKEIEDGGISHGRVSGALSTLHEDGYIERLTEKRDHHEVYVMPDDVLGRETRLHASVARRAKEKAVADAIDDVIMLYGDRDTAALSRLIYLVDPRGK